MVELVGLIQKRPDLTTEAFQAHWLGVHAEIARTLPGLRRYAVNFIDRARHPTRLTTASRSCGSIRKRRWTLPFAGPVGRRIAADIPTFIGTLTRVVVDEHVML